MNRKTALVALGFLLAAIVLPVLVHAAEENFPPPQFSQNYQFPQNSFPNARPAMFELIDAGVLLAALLLATYIGLKKRSRAMMVMLTVFSLLYFGFFRKGCICAIGSVQNVALAIFSPDYALSLTTALFFMLPLLFAIWFGRVFCSGVCPLGAIQELVLVKPVKVAGWLDRSLSTIPFIYLAFALLFAATGSRFIICEFDPFVSFFRMSGPLVMIAAGVAILLLSTVVGRPYCRYACPYGVLLRICSFFARWKVTITPPGEDCITCHLCADICPYGAILPPTEKPGTLGRNEGKEQLTAVLLMLPLIITLGAMLGRMSSPVLAQTNAHVRLADRLWLEEQGRVEGKTEATEAWSIQGLPAMEAYKKAAEVRGQFDTASWFVGGFIGLVLGLKITAMSVRRRRGDYVVETGSCVACARCYSYCPVGRADEQDIFRM